MIFNLYDDREFLQKYLELFTIRFTYGSMQIENVEILTDPKYAVGIYNNKEALNQLIDEEKPELFISDIINVADTINRNIAYFDRGFRRTNVEVNGANFIPPAAKDVHMKIYCLLDTYYHIWDVLKDTDPYLREAMFHIQFLKIHPFEDGNGRVSRILLNYNLCLQNLAPVIIAKEERRKYFDMIDNDKVEELAKFFKEKSYEEFDVMKTIYDNLNDTRKVKKI